MSDADDAVSEALGKNRQLAVARLVRKEELQAELAKRRADQARLEAEAASAAGGPEALLTGIATLRAEVDARITALTEELALVDSQLQGARTEMKELRRMGDRAAVAAALPGAPDELIKSDEEIALENARSHISGLDVQVRVNDELSGLPPVAAPAPAVAPTPAVSRESAEDAARRKFDELRKARETPAPGTPPKKTF